MYDVGKVLDWNSAVKGQGSVRRFYDAGKFSLCCFGGKLFGLVFGHEHELLFIAVSWVDCQQHFWQGSLVN